MIRSALFFGVCLFFATPCFAGLCTTSGGKTTISATILGSTSFDPNASPYVDPSTLTNTVPTNSTVSIQGAYNIAPSFFQTQLCNLDGIYFDPKDCTNGDGNNCTVSNATPAGDSWGYREHPSQKPNGPFHRYLGLSAAFWPQGNTPQILSAYENTLMQLLINWPSTDVYQPGGGNPPVNLQPSFGNATPDNANMTILAALAHEYGHILWYDTFRPTPGGAYDFKSFCRGAFYTDTWISVNPPPSWRTFGESDGEPIAYGNPKYDTKVGDLALSLLGGHYAKAQNKLHNMYRTEAHWASLFGAFSPDEDFVEMFVLNVLLNANTPLTSLPLNLYDRTQNPPKLGTPDDIAADYAAGKKPELGRRIACFPH